MVIPIYSKLKMHITIALEPNTILWVTEIKPVIVVLILRAPSAS